MKTMKEFNKRKWLLIAGLLLGLISPGRAQSNAFVKVSAENPRYLELSDGKAYIPVGINICWPRFVSSEDSVIRKMEHYLTKLGENGGNFTRVWLSAPMFEVEHKKAGEYDEVIARRIDKILEIAGKYNIKVKFCLENFRDLTNRPAMFAGSVPFDKPIYYTGNGGPLSTMDEYFTSQKGKDLFLKRVDFFAKRYKDHPGVFGWELWNEINAVKVSDRKIILDWTKAMLPELKKRFPNHLAMQSLGSFDTEQAKGLYHDYSVIPDNEIAQVHRYLDQGGALPVTRGAVDVLAYDAVSTLRGFGEIKPVILSEAGAVEPHHAGPSLLYPKDTEGMMLHDYLFAAFFAGAAGPGQSWHWDYYIDKHDLWYHLARFNKAIEGIDPRKEAFEPFEVRHDELTIYGLKGKKHVLVWCRDKANTWQSELNEGLKPQTIKGKSFKLPFEVKVKNASVYNPWEDTEQTINIKNDQVNLPEFKRSGVIKLTVK